MKKLILRLLIVIFAATFAVSGFNIIKSLVDTAKTEKFYENLQSDYVSPVAPPSAEEETATQVVKEPAVTVDFTALSEKNKDIVGWLYLPDTVLNYPVCQAEDNDKYLRRDLDGKKLSAGTLFVDYRCKAVNTDTNYIIYGHNMKNGTMFKTVVNYKEQSFYEKKPVLYYLTPENSYKIEPVLGLVVSDNDTVYRLDFTNAQMLDYISSKKSESTFSSTVPLSDEDKFITLSTCSYEYENARFVLIGKISEVEQ